ncbi:MAG: 6-hydroxymethylpterin diphosphokinase MptE-like protein [Campylobacterota bacterium]|nr:6-hydroxymethylpterin diphosphokinase MptE-like protein [Campylobacterota bacterium]
MNLKEKIILNYKNNLEFIAKIDTILFQKVNKLSLEFSNNLKKEIYSLKYIEETNSFTIYNNLKNEYINNKKIDKTDIQSVDLLSETKYTNTNNYIKSHFSQYNNIINRDDNIDKNLNIDKFLFLGTLLGEHILDIDKKIDAKYYFISEESLDIFRLSLFITPYYLLKNKRVIFSINDNKNEIYEKYKLFHTLSFSSNYSFNYNSTDYNINYYLDNIKATISSISPFTFNYNRILNLVQKRAKENILKYHILKTKDNNNILKNSPILLTGAGPSLEKNIKWIIENRKKLIIVSMGASVKYLIKNNIIPDIIISIDDDIIVLNQFPKDIRDKIKNTLFLGSTISHKKVLDIFKNKILFETMTYMKENSKLLEGSSVGEVSLELLLSLGANNIYLLGTDLALDPNTKNSHISDHIHNDNKINDTIKVKGNLREYVDTTLRFNNSIIAYNKILKPYNIDSNNIYNLCDGAYINYTIPTNIKNIIIKNNISNIDIFKILKNNYSKKGFSKKEYKSISKSFLLITKILKEIKYISKQEILSYNDFEQKRIKLYTLMLVESQKYERYYLHKLFFNYIMMFEPYIKYNINKIDINKANKRWCKHTKDIAKKYIKIYKG